MEPFVIKEEGFKHLDRVINLCAKQHHVRYILLAEPLLEEYAAPFKGMSKSEVDEMMQSFHFKQCVQHTELANTLAESSRESSRN